MKTWKQKYQQLYNEHQELVKVLANTMAENNARAMALNSPTQFDPVKYRKEKIDRAIEMLCGLKFISNAARQEYVIADEILKELLK